MVSLAIGSRARHGERGLSCFRMSQESNCELGGRKLDATKVFFRRSNVFIGISKSQRWKRQCMVKRIYPKMTRRFMIGRKNSSKFHSVLWRHKSIFFNEVHHDLETSSCRKYIRLSEKDFGAEFWTIMIGRDFRKEFKQVRFPGSRPELTGFSFFLRRR